MKINFIFIPLDFVMFRFVCVVGWVGVITRQAKWHYSLALVEEAGACASTHSAHGSPFSWHSAQAQARVSAEVRAPVHHPAAPSYSALGMHYIAPTAPIRCIIARFQYMAFVCVLAQVPQKKKVGSGSPGKIGFVTQSEKYG